MVLVTNMCLLADTVSPLKQTWNPPHHRSFHSWRPVGPDHYALVWTFTPLLLFFVR